MKKTLFLVLVVACLISPVMGETINYDYSDDSTYSEGYGINLASNTYNGYVYLLKAYDIGALQNVKSTYYSLGCTNGMRVRTTTPTVANYYPSWLSDTFDFTMSIGGSTIGYGDVLIINYCDSNGACYKVSFYYTFDNYDVSGYSGAQTLSLSIPDWEGNAGGLRYVSTENYGTCMGSTSTLYPLNSFTGNTMKSPIVTVQTDSLVEFHERLNYTLSDDDVMSLDFKRNSNSNLVKITGNETGIYYNKNEGIDLLLSVHDDFPLNIQVTNPTTSEIWNNSIPETSTPDEPDEPDEPETDPAEFTAYIYDAQTGNLISWSYLNKTYSGIAPLPTTTYDPDGVIQDVVYWEDTDYAVFTAGATGYETTTTTYNYTALTAPAGSTDNVMSFQLVPSASIGNSSYALSFFVSQEISSNSEVYTRSVDASINCNGVQHLTGPAGTTWFNVSAGDLEYTVSKNGFETLQGTVSVSGNTLETVYLTLGPEVPTISDDPDGDTGDIDPDAMHESVAEAYAQFGEFIPEAVMIACVLFLLSMFKKF